MGVQNAPAKDDSTDPKLDLAYKELDYRRDKQWQVFTWCSTILVSITGGLILFQSGPQPRLLHPSQQTILSFAIVVLVVYAVSWLTHNWHREERARNCFSKDTADALWPPKQRSLGGERMALVLLAIAALLATWY